MFQVASAEALRWEQPDRVWGIRLAGADHVDSILQDLIGF